MWGGVSALYSRDARGIEHGDWVQSSLAVSASLTQLTLQVNEPPASAVGCNATGMTPYNRTFKVKGEKKYIYGQVPETTDVDAVLATVADMDTETAIAYFKDSLGAFAVPVNNCKEFAALNSSGESKTANFKAKSAGQGWDVELWEPSWFCFDGEPLSCAGAPTYSGSDAPKVLQELGYNSSEVLGLQQSRAIVPTNWYKWSASDTLTRGPEVSDGHLLEEGLE